MLVSEGFKQFRDSYFPEDEEKWKAAIELVNKHDSGIVSKEEFIKGMADISGKSYDFVADNINNNRPNETLIEYIRSNLKDKYKIGMLTNSGDNYASQMLDPEDVDLFDDVVLSYQYKMIKPQPEIFELAAKRLGVATNECIFIDDSTGHCIGAQAVGMQAVVYQSYKQAKTDLEKILAASPDN